MPLTSLSQGDTTDLKDAADALDKRAVATSDTLKDAAGPSDPGPKPLPLKDKDDLKKLNGAATQEGMYGGMVFGGLLTGLASTVKHPRITPNTLTLTFLLSSTMFSFAWTRHRIRAALGEQASVMAEHRLTRAPMGGTFLPDFATGDQTEVMEVDHRGAVHAVVPDSDPVPHFVGTGGLAVNDAAAAAAGDGRPPPEDVAKAREQRRIAAELRNLGTGSAERSRWTKGRGLAGEVEEEPEMRDTFMRPGVPRREV